MLHRMRLSACMRFLCWFACRIGTQRRRILAFKHPFKFENGSFSALNYFISYVSSTISVACAWPNVYAYETSILIVAESSKLRPLFPLYGVFFLSWLFRNWPFSIIILLLNWFSLFMKASAALPCHRPCAKWLRACVLCMCICIHISVLSIVDLSIT